MGYLFPSSCDRKYPVMKNTANVNNALFLPFQAKPHAHAVYTHYQWSHKQDHDIADIFLLVI